MKKILFTISVGLVMCGCANTPYKVAGTTIVAGETAIKEYNAYVLTLPAQNTNQNDQVYAAYLKYQGAMELVADAGAVYQSAANAGTNSTLTAALEQATVNANSELTDLKSLITSFGVTLK